MKHLLIPIFLFLIFQSQAQDNKLDLILKEGQLMYRMEQAASNANKLLRENNRKLFKKVGGFVSYETKEHRVKTIFFGKKNYKQILATYEFDSIPQTKAININTSKRKANELELSLIEMRVETQKILQENIDGYFQFYQNTRFTIIPLSTGNINRVYILTASYNKNVIIFGNDYELVFDNKAAMTKRRRIHQSIIQVNMLMKKGEQITSTHHTHINNSDMDPSDICTMLLYQNYLHCEKHTVKGTDYTTVFDMKTQQLSIQEN